MKRPIYIGAALALALWLGLVARSEPRRQAQAGPAEQPIAAARFAFGGNAAEIPAEFAGNLIFLPVHVNHSQPSLFQLDSTALASSIDPGRAAELGLPNPPVPLLNLVDVDISLSSLAERADAEFGPRVGREYDGTLGNDFLGGVVAELDYARETVRLYDPAVYKYSGHATALHVNFVSGLPVVAAKFSTGGGKPLEADFVVNTALDASVLISEHYAEAHRLLNHLKTIPADPAPDGTQEGVLGRIRSFQIGPYVIPAPIAIFSKRSALANGAPRLAGEIGGGMLRRFNLVLNYSHQQILFDPNSDFRNDEFEDMSGVSVIAGGPALKRFEVVQVRRGTPGADAGIQKGDIIEGIDDEPAADLSLLAIRKLFRQPGHPYKILVSRDGKALTVTLKLRRLL